MVSKVLPDLAATHLPPISSFFGESLRNAGIAFWRLAKSASIAVCVVAIVHSLVMFSCRRFGQLSVAYVERHIAQFELYFFDCHRASETPA